MALAALEVGAEVVAVAQEVVVRNEAVERLANEVDVDGRRRYAEPAREDDYRYSCVYKQAW